MDPRERLARYAELAVRVGANVGAGQYLAVDALVEHAPLAREIAAAAYAAGARFVDVRYADMHVRRSMIEKGSEEALRFTPDWVVQRLERLGAEQGAQILITGQADPDLFADLDQERVGRAQPVGLNEAHQKNVTSRAVNWTIVAYPTAGWAQKVYGEPDLERLWSDLANAVRLDEADPVAAWNEHIDRLDARARSLNEASFDAIRFQGSGTDLTVGLLPGSRWLSAAARSASGQRHVVNLPTEEVFTTPDRTRAEGVVRASMDLALGGLVVSDLQLRFEDGRIVDVEAREGADYIRAELESDDGAARLGEVALVDETSRVGRLGRVFFNGLFDENAASHLAYGAGFPYCVEGVEAGDSEALAAAGVNESSVHTDFMVGGPGVDVIGLTRSGESVPIVRRNVWQLGS